MLNDTQRRAREETVYRAVLTLLEQGTDLATLTVSKIATAAGMGKGTIYEYFSSRGEIVAGLSCYCLQTEIALLEAALAPHETLAPAVEALCRYLQDFATHRSGTFHILAETLQRDHTLLPLQNRAELAGGFETVLLALVGRLRQNGTLAEGLSDGYCVNAITAACLPAILRLAGCTPHPAGEAALADTALLLRRSLGK